MLSLSKNKVKFIRSLELKKNRREENAFVAEGHKLVGELLGSFTCRLTVATAEWYASHPDVEAEETILVTRDELARASLLKTPQDVLAVFTQAEADCDPKVADCSLCLALDDVQDPGNLGTIVRIADWFGIRDIFCSHGTADIYSPKTVQATMGAMARVRLHYCTLAEVLREVRSPVFGTFLDGESIYDATLSTSGVIIMGNEGKGISQEVASCVSRRILIPSFPRGAAAVESLNVAAATAIVCSEFRRRELNR